MTKNDEKCAIFPTVEWIYNIEIVCKKKVKSGTSKLVTS